MTSVVAGPVRVSARLDAPLSRWLWLVKWLLVLPHMIVLAGLWTAFAVLSVAAFFAILFTGRYPRGVFDLLLGMQRWVLRVAAYSALMTDVYPPFRLEMGGTEASTLAVPSAQPPGSTAADPATVSVIANPATVSVTEDPAGVPGKEPPRTWHGTAWSTGRIVSVVIGSILLTVGAGTAVGATAVLAVDTTGRDAAGFVDVPAQGVVGTGHALVFDPFELESDLGARQLGSIAGDVRIGATGEQAVFVGIGPADAVEGYLAGVQRDRVVTLSTRRAPVLDQLPGGAPATAPAAQTFWAESATGPGAQQLTWTVTEGRWAVVVMNADGGSPVVAELSLGATAPWLGWVWITMYLGAGLALICGGVLVLLAVRGRRV